MTQAERARHFQVSRHGIWYALQQLAVTRKKKDGLSRTRPLAAKTVPAPARAVLSPGQTPVHIDECGFVPLTARRYGYAPKGQRVEGVLSGHRRPSTSLIAARMEGRLEEPFLFGGTCDTVVFNTWLKTRLCPRLHDHYLVIMDNAAFHKSPETAQLIKETGTTLLFLPPYFPDLNPHRA